MYQNGARQAPNFGNRQQVDLLGAGEVEPSARNPRESADLTIDMLMGNKGALAARRQPSDEIPHSQAASNMPRN